MLRLALNDSSRAPLPAAAAAAELEPRMGLRSLPLGRVQGFDVKGRVYISCIGGEVWVTGPGIGDRILASGDHVDIVGPGRVVVQALKTAQLWVAR